jgi:exodeoxyribonuclease VII small subunit
LECSFISLTTSSVFSVAQPLGCGNVPAFLPAPACSAYNKAMPAEPLVTPNFETSIAELEALVKELERGDLPLEKSLELFERGMKLSDQCRKQLAAAETKVEMLIKRGSETVSAPFDEGKG